MSPIFMNVPKHQMPRLVEQHTDLKQKTHRIYHSKFHSKINVPSVA